MKIAMENTAEETPDEKEFEDIYKSKLSFVLSWRAIMKNADEENADIIIKFSFKELLSEIKINVR